MAILAKRLDFSTPHPLRNEAEYDMAAAAFDELLAAEPALGTREYDRLELLSVLVEAYDDEHFQMGQTATPQAVVDFLLEQRGMARAELVPFLGGRSRVSEFFAGKRPLSISQIQHLRRLFNVSADVLLEQLPA